MVASGSRLVQGLLSVLCAVAVEAKNYSAYRLRLAHGSNAPLDPYKQGSIATWRVEELVFASDAACQKPLALKKGIASAGATKAMLAFDGNRLTHWAHECITGEDPVDQCRASFTEGAWLGVELHSSAAVKCIALDSSMALKGLVLDGWAASNEKWLALQEFGQLPKADSSPVKLQRLWGGACGDTSVNDASSGSMNSLSGNLGSQVWVPSCESGTQWRFISAEPTKSWVVFELELHRDIMCRDRAPDGVPMTSDDNPEAARRFQDSQLSTGWSASCTGGAGKPPCEKDQLWVGLSFPRSEGIACVQIFQSHESEEGETFGAFALSMWDGESWVVRQEFISVVSAQWSYLSPQSEVRFTRWRLINNAKVEKSWSVHELIFTRDAVCSERIPGGMAISSGVDAYKAFDGNKDTVWVSQCQDCGPNVAYLGQHFEVPALVRCVSLQQGGDKDYMPSSVALEMWDNETSPNFIWRRMRIFPMLVAGLNKLSPWWGVSGTRFQVSNLEPAPGGWRVAEIRLFSDFDCRDRVLGMGFSSDTDPADAERGMDGDVSTFWHASCCPKLSIEDSCLNCDSAGAWIGIIATENTTVNCMQIIQKGVRQPRGPLHFATTGISLKGWDGITYAEIYEWKNLPGDDWVELSVGREHLANSISCKVNEEWERCNATGWNCSRYKEELMCNETYQSDVDCGGIEMAFACKEACCLCGKANSGHCPKEDAEDAGLPAWLIPLSGALGGLFLLSCSFCGIGWKRRSCHHRKGCHKLCHCLDRCMRRHHSGS